MEKDEIAHFEQFHLFPQCFPKAFFLQSVKMSLYGEKGYVGYLIMMEESALLA